MRKILILLCVCIATFSNALAQTGNNSYLTSDAYKNNPRFYLSTLDPKYFGTNVLIDRISSPHMMDDFNGVTSIIIPIGIILQTNK